MMMEKPKHIYSDLYKFSPMVQSKILFMSLKHARKVILFKPPWWPLTLDQNDPQHLMSK